MARKIELKIVGDSRSLERAFTRSSRATEGFGAKVGGASRQIAKGVAIVGAAAAGIGVVTGKSFAAFEETLDRVVGLAGGARSQVEQFGKTLLKLGPEVAKGPQELGEALYFTASAGIAVSNQLDVVTRSAKASASGLGETQVVADAVTSAMNAYGAEVVNAARATDVLVNTVKFGKGEAESFAPVIGNVAAIAAQLGVRFEEVGAALAAQTRLGTAAEIAAIQLQATFSSLLKTTPKAAKALASVGLSAEGLREQLKQKGLLSVLTTLKDRFGDNTAAMAEAFPNIRALRGLLSLVGKNADEARKVFEGMADSTGALGTAFDAVSEGEAFKFQQTMASLKSAGIQLGAIFAPVGKLVARGLSAGLDVFNEFLADLGEAKTTTAKLEVIWSGAQEATEGAFDLLSDAVADIDWGDVWKSAKGVADGLQDQLETVDFGFIGQEIGQAIGDAVEFAIPAAQDLAERINDAVKAIDFSGLGRRLGPELASAIVAAFVTLLDPAFWIRNWDLALAAAAAAFGGPIGRLASKLLRPLVGLGETLVLGLAGSLERLGPLIGQKLSDGLFALPALVARLLSPLTGVVTRIFGKLGKLGQFAVKVLGIAAAINAVVGFAKKVGEVFGGIGRSIGGLWDRALKALEIRALKAAIRLIEPFTHIPGFLGGGAFQDLQAKWKNTLGAMTQETANRVQDIQSHIDGVHGTTVTVAINTVVNATEGGPRRPEEGGATQSIANAARKAKRVTQQVVNTADTAAADEKAAAARAAKARAAAAKAAKAAAARAKKAQDEASSAFATLMDRFDLRFERAQQTRNFRDDLQILREREAAVRARIKVVGHTVELDRELLRIETERKSIQAQIRQQRADAQAAAQAKAQGRQFRALGLTSEGTERIAGVGALRRRLGTLREQIKGTSLDTSKTGQQLDQIAAVLSGKFGKVGKDVRAAIQRMFGEISGALSDGTDLSSGPLAKFRVPDADALLKGIGLDPEEAKKVARLLSRSSGGAVPIPTGGVGGAFGLPPSVQAPGSTTYNFYGDIRAEDFPAFERDLERKTRRKSNTRSGTRPGGRV